MSWQRRRAKAWSVREAILEYDASPAEPAAAEKVSRAWAALNKKALATAWKQVSQGLSAEPTRHAHVSTIQRPMTRTLTSVPAPSERTEKAPLGSAVPSVTHLVSAMTGLREDTFSGVLVDGPGVEAQLQALFGASAFGRQDPRTYEPTTMGTAPQRGNRWGRVVLVALLVVFGTGTIGIVNAGIARRAEQKSIALTRDLLGLVRTGSLEQAAAALPVAASAAEDAGLEDGFATTELRTEAVLYRYLDAKPERRMKLEALLDSKVGRKGYDAVIAHALLGKPVSLLSRIDALDEVAEKESDDAEAELLMGRILSRAGSVRRAEDHFAKAERIEAANLVHLKALAEHYLRHGKWTDAEKVLDRMRDMSPRAPWTQLVEMSLVRLTASDDKSSARAELPENIAEWPPVPRAEAYLLRAIRLFDGGQAEAGLEALDRAMESVHREPLHLAELAEQLINESHADGARRVFSVIAESKNGMSPTTLAELEARLLLAEGARADAQPIFSRLYQVGELTDPVAGAAYAGLLESSDGQGPHRASAVLGRLLEAWPDRHELKVRRAKALLSEGQRGEAEVELHQVISLLGKNGPRPAVGDAQATLADIAHQSGDLKKAKLYAKRALKADPNQATGIRILKVITMQEAAERQHARRKIRSKRKKRRSKKKHRRKRRR